jgi:hypothetical protein
MDYGRKTNDSYLNNAAEPVDTSSHCSSDDLYIKVTECAPAPAPPAEAKKAMLDLGATFKVMSSWDYNWRNPRLDGRFGAHISKADGNAKKPYWIEVDFLQDATVYAVVLKRRGDGTSK